MRHFFLLRGPLSWRRALTRSPPSHPACPPPPPCPAGAEGLIFGRGADTSWLRAAQVVLLRGQQDPLARLYGLRDVASHVARAVRGLGFTVVEGGGHVALLSADVAAGVREEAARAAWEAGGGPEEREGGEEEGEGREEEDAAARRSRR